MEPIVNRVAESAIQVFNLEDLWDGGEIVEFDVAPFLYQGLILREKDFRERVKETDWSAYAGLHIAVFCSADAIVPTWAYMLVASRLEPHAASIVHGRRADLLRSWYAARLAELDLEKYRDAMVVIKGCGSGVVPADAYVEAQRRLQGVAKKIMYGEPCSMVPLWRRA